MNVIQERAPEGQRVRLPWQQPKVTFVNTDPDMAVQSHADSCDIDKIVARFHRTGQLPDSQGNPQYVDNTPYQKDLTTLLNESRSRIDTFEGFKAGWKPAPPIPEPQPEPPPVQ